MDMKDFDKLKNIQPPKKPVQKPFFEEEKTVDETRPLPVVPSPPKPVAPKPVAPKTELQFGTNSQNPDSQSPAPKNPNSLSPDSKKKPAANPQSPNPQRKRKPRIDPKLKQIEELRKKKAYRQKMKRRKEHARTSFHIFGSLVLVVAIVTTSVLLSSFVVRAFLDFSGISSAIEFSVFVEIPAEASTEEIAAILAHSDNRIISMPGFFTFYSRITDKDGKYLSGLFNLTSTMSYSQIISTLQNRPQSTETVLIQITEGMTARMIAEELQENGVCRAVDFLEFCRDKLDIFDFERRIIENPLRFFQMEGYLFPETHEFFVINGFDLENDPDMDTSVYAERAARTIFRHMNTQFTREMYRKIGDLGNTLPIDFGLDEFMTLASMVQWEAAAIDDMRDVASVFLNRLRNPANFPRMESDVTEKYANQNILPYRTSANATLIDAMMSAYNTYESEGLPPGPVCNPGMDAMLAVLDATVAKGFFYFCSNLDTGEMFFARTLVEHNQNEIKAGVRDANGNLIFRD
jgi:UPF0755 protein